MKKRDSPELIDEKKAVAEIYGSNQKITSQIQIQYRELTGRARETTTLWETDARIAHEHDSDYMTLLRAVTSTEREIVALLMEKVDENKRMQQLRSETSERDQISMLSLYKQLRANGVKEAEDELPRLQAMNQRLETAVKRLEEFVQGSIGEK